MKKQDRFRQLIGRAESLAFSDEAGLTSLLQDAKREMGVDLQPSEVWMEALNNAALDFYPRPPEQLAENPLYEPSEQQANEQWQYGKSRLVSLFQRVIEQLDQPDS